MESEPRTEKKPRSLLGCVFSGTLGCGAFLLGAAVSAGLFAPWLLGDWVKKGFESSFHSNHDGQLRIGHLQLSWRGPQTATDVKLLEPQGNEEVLVFDAKLPSLLTVLGLRTEDWQADVVVKYARLAIEGDGRSNLGRALRDRGRAVDWFGYLSQFAGESSQTPGPDSDAQQQALGEAVVTIRADPGAVSIQDTRRADGPIELEGLEADVVRQPSGEVVVTGDFDFAHDHKLHASLTRPPDDAAWSAVLEGDRLPTRLFDSLVGGAGRLTGLVGAECRATLRFQANEDAVGVTDVEGELEGDGTSVEWRLSHSDGQLASRGAQKCVVVRATLRPEHSEIVRWLFPWVQAAHGKVGEQIELTLESVQMSLQDIASTFDAVITLQMGGTEYVPIEAFGNTMALTATMSLIDAMANTVGLASDDPQTGDAHESESLIVLRVFDGVLVYEGVTMMLDGRRCSIHGERELSSDSVDLEIDLPLSAPATALVGADSSSSMTVPARLLGPWRDPGLTVDLSEFPDSVSAKLKSGVQGTVRDLWSKTLTAIKPKDE